MRKYFVILVCLFLFSCGGTPKSNNESYLSDSTAHKTEASAAYAELDSLNAPTENAIKHDIAGIRHTYTPLHVNGDKSFDGECDLYSSATLKISGDQTKLYIELYFQAKEPHLDNTEVSGKKWVFEGDLNNYFDDSSQPRVNIETNTISILVQEK